MRAREQGRAHKTCAGFCDEKAEKINENDKEGEGEVMEEKAVGERRETIRRKVDPVRRIV